MSAMQALISAEYLQQLRAMHESARGIGHSGRKHAAEVLAMASALGIRRVLDYGCGAGTLKHELQAQGVTFDIREYDPAVPGKDDLPSAADLCVCTDVLEHVEPDKIHSVIAHIRALTIIAAFVVIATTRAHKSLPDGRNAHLIVAPAEWWTSLFADSPSWRVRSRFVRRDKIGAPVEVSLWLAPKERE